MAKHKNQMAALNFEVFPGTHIQALRVIGQSLLASLILIPNGTFLVRFGSISGEFGRAMVRILARRSRAKILMARPNEPDMPPQGTIKVRLRIYRTHIQRIILRFGNKICQALYRMAGKENNTNQQILTNGAKSDE